MTAVIAAPLVVVFGALFMWAAAVFADLVLSAVRIDFELIASHLVLFSVSAWLATGYLRGFLRGTDLPQLRARRCPPLTARSAPRVTVPTSRPASIRRWPCDTTDRGRRWLFAANRVKPGSSVDAR